MSVMLCSGRNTQLTDVDDPPPTKQVGMLIAHLNNLSWPPLILPQTHR